MTTSQYGPGEFCVIALPGRTVPEELAWAIVETLMEGVVSLLDAAIVTRETHGALTVTGLERIGDDDGVASLDATAEGLTGSRDLERLAAELAPDQSALVLLVEHSWMRRIGQAAADGGGHLLHTERLRGSALNDVAGVVGVQLDRDHQALLDHDGSDAI
ncbi:DUF6325 family protein [Rathayibacter sp. CAU 1779]